jgi:phosphatidylglycerophosphate synthase
VGVVALLVALQHAAGLGHGALLAGLASGLALAALLTHGLRRASRWWLLPADRVTLTRGVLVCGVAALVADGRRADLAALVTVSAVALALDAVDGRVARATGTASPFGARFDMETDAVLILVLSVVVSRQVGWWVLGIGAARYVLLLVRVATRWVPWLAGQVAPRRWRKVVAAYQGVVLTIVAAGVLPGPVTTAALVAGLAALVASFATEVVTLWRQQPDRPTTASDALEQLPSWPPAPLRESRVEAMP